MNYRHAFHAGNHADVLKHVALLALCDALLAPAATPGPIVEDMVTLFRYRPFAAAGLALTMLSMSA